MGVSTVMKRGKLKSEPGKRFLACSESLVKISFVLAIVATMFVISSLVAYFSLYPFLEEPFSLLYTALLAAATGWFSFLSLMTATPVHKIIGDSIILAGWHPMSDFGEIEIQISDIKEAKPTTLLNLIKMGWFHGRVHALSNFVQIDLKKPIMFATHWEALHKYRIPPWYGKKIDTLVITVTDPGRFLSEIGYKQEPHPKIVVDSPATAS